MQLQQSLYVTFNNKKYSVASLEDASAKWCAFRNASMEGVSTIGNGVIVKDNDGNFVGRISYNGRIWLTQENII